MILANTFHLWGIDDLHKLMNWEKPIFTDSGGFQLFSLGERLDQKEQNNEFKPFNVKITEDGVSFQRGSDGSKMMLTPEESIKIQTNLGSDVMVCLDEFTGNLNDEKKVLQTVERTTRWAKRSKDEFIKMSSQNRLLLGIVQGALFEDLRKKSACEIRDIGFDGYAIGGVAVGNEPSEQQYKAVDMSIPFLEENKFKHLLGVGTPEQIIQNVARGIDSFDCVIPTREARHGRLYVNLRNNGKFKYKTIDITKPVYKNDFDAVDSNCDCFGCKNHSKAYLYHLFNNNELLGLRLATLHNLQFYMDLMRKIRQSIENDVFENML